MQLLGIRAVPLSIGIVLVIEEFGTTAPHFFDANRRLFVGMRGEDHFEDLP